MEAASWLTPLFRFRSEAPEPILRSPREVLLPSDRGKETAPPAPPAVGGSLTSQTSLVTVSTRRAALGPLGSPAPSTRHPTAEGLPQGGERGGVHPTHMPPLALSLCSHVGALPPPRTATWAASALTSGLLPRTESRHLESTRPPPSPAAGPRTELPAF